MKKSRIVHCQLAAAVAAVATLFLAIDTILAQQPAPKPGFAADAGSIRSDSDYDVLAQGPVHEAFADVVSFDPASGITVNRKPPEVIDELPPETKPQGANVVWIPGYWGWDEQRDDFVWVSGIWRAVPPGQSWTPGYWEATDTGYQWISGSWFTGQAETTYLPEPPRSLEEGPSSPQPSADHFWIPGCWRYRDANYVWRPGYWYGVQPNWVWVPSCYDWTPYGYIYRAGYWDYPLERRGLLFAPIYFPHQGYARAGFYYRPNHVINTGLLLANLFVHGGQQRYYYGDYSSRLYHDRGYRPWFEHSHRRDAYSPLYTHYQWTHRHDQDDWKSNLARQYRERSDHAQQHSDKQSPRTVADLQQRKKESDKSSRESDASRKVVRSFDEMRREKSGQFERTSQHERSSIEQNVAKYRQMQHAHAESPRDGNAADNRGDKPGPKFNGASDGRVRREAAKPVIQFGPPKSTESSQRGMDARPKFDSAKKFDPTRSKDTSKSKNTPKSHDSSRQEDTTRSTTRSKGEFPAQAPGSSLNRRPALDQLIKERSVAPPQEKSKSYSAGSRSQSDSKSRDSSQFKSRGSSDSKYSGSSRTESRGFDSSRGKSSGSSDRGKSGNGSKSSSSKSSKSSKSGKGKN